MERIGEDGVHAPRSNARAPIEFHANSSSREESGIAHLRSGKYGRPGQNSVGTGGANARRVHIDTIFASNDNLRTNRGRFAKRLLLVASIILATCISAGPGFAQAVEYVRVCSSFAVGQFYIPGTDSCAYARNLPYQYNTSFGTYSTQPGAQSEIGREHV